MAFSGYVLNGEQDGFYYMSLSRLHPQRIHATKRLSESTAADPQQHIDPCSAAAQVEEAVMESEAETQPTEAEGEVRHFTLQPCVVDHFISG